MVFDFKAWVDRYVDRIKKTSFHRMHFFQIQQFYNFTYLGNDATQACVLMDEKKKHIFLIQKTAVTIWSKETVKKIHRFLYTNNVNKDVTENLVSE